MVLSFVKLDGWIWQVIQNVAEETIQSGSRQKQYCNLVCHMPHLATCLIVEPIHDIVEYCEPLELNITSNAPAFGECKADVLERYRDHKIAG